MAMSDADFEQLRKDVAELKGEVDKLQELLFKYGLSTRGGYSSESIPDRLRELEDKVRTGRR